MADPQGNRIWHNLSVEEALKETGSSSGGLTACEAANRLQQHGPNELAETNRKPAWKLFAAQFADFMILVLAGAAVISGIIGEITDTVIILLIVFVNAVIGFIQEYRAEKAMEALKKMAAHLAFVIRDGAVTPLPTAELVPGDLVLLEAGNSVPADIRLTETFALRADESALTGESVPVDKHTEPLDGKPTTIGDRTNMIYRNTTITYGRGRGVVVATGMNTEIGKIARMLQEPQQMSPLQRRMQEFGRKLSYIILLICVLLFGIGLLRGEPPMQMLLVSISLAVAAIPEALPALITISLARGAKRLVNQHALIRKLPAVETLGSVTYICSDKTGTLTQNRMQVKNWESAEINEELNIPYPPFIAALALNSDVRFSPDGSMLGDPTETALMDFVISQRSRQGVEEILRQLPRIAEFPFDSERKCMTTIHSFGGRFLALTKGAAEIMASKLVHEPSGDGLVDKVDEWAANGLRVLVFAYRVLDDFSVRMEATDVERDMRYAGMTGLMDPPRKESRQAIADCRQAGITPVMITGDHPITASAIAREIGLIDHEHKVISGTALQEFSDADFDSEVERIRVYARVSPEQKLRIVRALQRKKHFVAMTGDGVNDAPSLKAADIGVAMGISGTDVSKEAAHMILLDDNFSTIVKAVREGRRIYDNIRKFVKYIMTCNGAEIWTLFLAPFMGLPIPLLPVHILWINLVTDGLPGLALAGEKAEKNIMRRPPRHTGESLFADGIGFHIVWVGLLMSGVTLATQAYAIANGMHWQTMVFTVLSLSQLGHVLAIRSDREFLFQQGITSNLNLFITVLLTTLLQLAVIYLPEANAVFRTQPLSWNELLICFAASAVVFHAVEVEKWVKKRTRK